MTNSAGDQRARARRHRWLEAEHYDFAEIDRIYRPHPEGLPTIQRNCVLIGYPGVGKTTVLRKLCHDLASQRGFLPIYIQMDAWTAKIQGETTHPIDKKQRPREKQLGVALRVLLGLALVDRVNQHARHAIARAATSMFPGEPPVEHEWVAWVGRHLDVLRSVPRRLGGCKHVYSEQMRPSGASTSNPRIPGASASAS